MSLNQPLIAELQQEAHATRKCLERLPADKFDWKPHEKSTSLRGLAIHVAEMFGWLDFTINKDELDFAQMDYKPAEVADASDLVKLLDKNLSEGIESLKNASDERLMQIWTMRSGEQIFMQMPKIEVIRGMVVNHIVHHRGQLSVYMRLLDVPVPAIYGPSADEQMM